MGFINFDQTRKLDIILTGRVAIDFNPVDYFQTLAQSMTFKKYGVCNKCCGRACNLTVVVF